jgi:hypothetical protein
MHKTYLELITGTSILRPFLLRLDKTNLPFFVLILLKKPWVLFLFNLLG